MLMMLHMLIKASSCVQTCEFGRCPRVLCNGQPCLPVGSADVPRQSTVKIFCPKCKDIYYPRSKYQVCAAQPRCRHPQSQWTLLEPRLP